ncbi:MAG: glycoside hydrolase family 3 C-terminal domain-containing protein [Polyangiaceae bacterium]
MPNLPFQDPDLPVETRVNDLVGRLSLEEKAAQMLHEAPAIARLGIPAYNWWNECVHGVARAGIATVFPQAIALAAMWNAPLLGELARAIADEARAKHHEYLRKGDHGIYKGLTFWAPNINIFRDPRWGRGHETYGECPYLTARLGVVFCKALQGNDPRFLKLVATPKHYAVHSGPEGLRHGFNALVGEKDLRETYLPAFYACVTEAKAESVMTAYNRTNGEPCSGSPTLIARILREDWGFEGYVVSDCWAIRDFHQSHGITSSPEESAALAVKAGCDLNCGCTYEHIPAAVALGLLTEEDVNRSVRRLFSARIRLGMFDAPARVPYASIPYEVNDCARHRDLARTAARESIVLLKNAAGLLPLRNDVARVAVIGPNAHDAHVLRANYSGTPSASVTPLDGIRERVSPATKVWYTDGCKHLGTATDGLDRAGNLSEAISMAERSDAVILCLGLSADIEGEQGDAGNSEAAGDKRDLRLTGLQNALLEAVAAVGKPTVLVVVSGSPVDLSWADEHVGAIVQSFYPGQAGGAAIADVLFGDYSPAGRLPVTFPRSVADVPPFEDYAMRGRTYRYLSKEPLYPFGFGLSYTRFRYSNLAVSNTRLPVGAGVEVTVTVENVGPRAGDEVVQLYLKNVESTHALPHHDLRGFERVAIESGESRRLSFALNARDFSLVDDGGRRLVEAGRFRITVGGSQPDPRSVELTGATPLAIEVDLTGAPIELR